MSLRVIDDAPPLRDLVVLGVGETHTPPPTRRWTNSSTFARRARAMGRSL
ncbi:hypothetical protein [Streptomyces europaeiscabiei]